MLKNNKHFWTIGFLILLGLGLRLLANYQAGSFWFDEYFSVYFAKFPFRQMMAFIIQDTNLPAYNVVLWAWLRIFGETEFITRLLSILFGTLNIPLLYFLGKKLFSRTTGLIAAIFYSLSVFTIYYTTEARTYGLMLFLGLLSAWYFWNLVEGKRSLVNWVAYTLVNSLLLFTHLMALLLILAQLLFVLIYFWRKRKFFGWAASWLINLIVFLPYLAIFFLNKKDIAFTGWHFNLPYTVHFFGGLFRNFVAYLNANSRLEPFYMLLFILALGSFLFIQRTGKNQFQATVKSEPAILFCWLFIALSFLSAFILNWNVPRYLIIVSAFIFLLMARGLENWFTNIKARRVALLVIVILLINPYGSLFAKRDNWHKINDCLNRNNPTEGKIIVHNFAFDLMLKKYYTGSLPVEGFYPLVDDLSYEERIIKNNWRIIVNPDNVNKLAEVVGDNKEIYLIEALYIKTLDERRNVFVWFLKNGWDEVKENFCEVENIKVFHLLKDG